MAERSRIDFNFPLPQAICRVLIKTMKKGGTLMLFVSSHILCLAPQQVLQLYQIPNWYAGWPGIGGIRESGPQLCAGCFESQPFLHTRMTKPRSRSTTGSRGSQFLSFHYTCFYGSLTQHLKHCSKNLLYHLKQLDLDCPYV